MSLLVTGRSRKGKKNRTPSFDLNAVRTSSWLRDVVFAPSLPSTNDLALELARKSSRRVPLLVLTDQQTAGRGRGDHRWWSAPGALTFSLVIDPLAEGLQTHQWPQISLTVAVAVREVLREFTADLSVGIRWPNDVHVEGRKICGVLVEPVSHEPSATGDQPAAPSEPTGLSRRTRNLATAHHRDKPGGSPKDFQPGGSPKDFQPGGSRVSSTRRERVVIGVGLNVNNSLAQAPEDVRVLGTSLVDLAGAAADLTKVLLLLVDRINGRVGWLASEDPRLPAAWQQNCPLSGKTVTLDLGSRIVEGRCHGIDRQGALLVETHRRVAAFYGGMLTAIQ